MKTKRYKASIMAEMLRTAERAEPTIGMKIAAIILTAASNRNVSVYTLLADAGIHQSIFARWRRGETTPSIAVIERLETAGIEVL